MGTVAGLAFLLVNHPDLDETTRRYMCAEVEMDRAAGTLFLSARLSPSGRVEYPELLLAAIESGNHDSLAVALLREWRLNLWETGRDKRGKPCRRRVPYNTADTLAEREFNRYYIRGVCARAVADGVEAVEVYRARAASRDRPELLALIGTRMDPRALLADLRVHKDAR